MSAIVIDTNVLLVADGQAEQMSPQCRAACVNRLEKVQSDEQVVLDRSWLILGEYGNRLDANRQPTPGSAFLKWLLQRKMMPQHVCFVTITAMNEEKTIFTEFPSDAVLLEDFDPADRKFVAVANAHGEKPPILQSADCKWLGWESRLASHGIRLEVLCRDELESIRIRKTT
ncbi:MAG: hypothetical protein WCJ35_16370 [Planctomycetota bacterium]